MSEIITGEAVPLDLRLAKLPSRMLAFLIDAAIQIGALLVAVALSSSVASVGDPSLFSFYGIVVVIVIFVGLPTAVETLSHGRSVGKLVMGLRVVRDDGGPIRFRHALVRALAAFFVDVWVLGWLCIGIFTSILSERGKRVGDFLAGTVVLRERVVVHAGPVPAMPPQLATWATGLELSRLPDGLALAARQYLARYHSLDSVAATSLGEQLATEVESRIGTRRPAGMPPWVFLSAVLAERRRREIARLSRPAATRQPTVPPIWQPAPSTAPPASAASTAPTSASATGTVPAGSPGDGPFALPS